MLAYILVFIFLLVPLFKYRHHQEKKSNRTYYIAEYIVLTCFMGFRYRVGGDSIRYEGYHLSQLNLNDLLSADSMAFNDYQPLWNLFSAICKGISDEFWVVQLLQAIIVNGAIFYVANKYCRFRYSFVIVYFFAQYLYFNCEIMREALAVSCFLLSYKYLVSRKYLKYYLFCLAAFMFHASALIMFVLPFFYPLIAKRRGAKLYLMLLLMALAVVLTSGIVLYSLASYLFSDNVLILEKLDLIDTSEGLNVFGIVSKLLFISPVIITQYCLTRSRSQNSDAENFILSMYLLFVLIGMFFLPLNRLENYFVIFFLMFFTNLICSPKYKRRFTTLIPLAVTIFCISQFNWYYTEVQLVGGTNHKFRRYQRYIPYHSLLNPKEDPEREWAVVMEGF